MSAFKSLSIDTVELAHPQREIGIWRLKQKMEMIRHQTVGSKQ